MSYPTQVRLIDVGPRDGLQNEKQPVPAAIKIELVQRLHEAGRKEIEVTSFVSPTWVPQMADNAEVMAGIERRADVRYSVLTPNLKGFEAAIATRPISMRSRAVCLPRACCFSMASRPEGAWARASRRRNSAILPAVVDRSIDSVASSMRLWVIPWLPWGSCVVGKAQ